MTPANREAPRDEKAVPEEAGYALLVALLAIIGLTALATGGFILSDAERATSGAYGTSVDAFYVAEAGLHQYLASASGVPTGPETYTFTDGTATVSGARMAETGTSGQSIYRIASVGRVDVAGGGRADRQVSVLAVLDPFMSSSPGAMVSGTGLNKNGSSGEINGNDACGGDDTAGLYVPPGGADGVDSSVTSGSPDVQEDSDPFSGLEWDWRDVIEGREMNFTHVNNSTSAGSGTWPDYDNIPSDEYPVIYADQYPDDYTQSQDQQTFSVDGNDDGRGTLIVRGNLDMNGSFEWNGTILVGGRIISDGNQTITGTLITGLNESLDPSESVSEGEVDLGNGTFTIQYDSCEVQKAGQGGASLVAKDHTWSEGF